MKHLCSVRSTVHSFHQCKSYEFQPYVSLSMFCTLAEAVGMRKETEGEDQAKDHSISKTCV